MRKFNVIFDVFDADGNKEVKIITVEAGSKKIAALRGMQTINKMEGYSDRFKNVAGVEEVA